MGVGEILLKIEKQLKISDYEAFTWEWQKQTTKY